MAERKQFEKTLWETEAKFRAIFELSSEAIVLLDTKGKVLTQMGGCMTGSVISQKKSSEGISWIYPSCLKRAKPGS
jgi:hypothetical protein